MLATLARVLGPSAALSPRVALSPVWADATTLVRVDNPDMAGNADQVALHFGPEQGAARQRRATLDQLTRRKE